MLALSTIGRTTFTSIMFFSCPNIPTFTHGRSSGFLVPNNHFFIPPRSCAMDAARPSIAPPIGPAGPKNAGKNPIFAKIEPAKNPPAPPTARNPAACCAFFTSSSSSPNNLTEFHACFHQSITPD